MNEYVALVLEHAVKYQIKAITSEFGLTSGKNFPCPDSWACLHLLKDFQETYGNLKVEGQTLTVVRKILMNFALQNAALFKTIKSIDYAVLVNTISCLIVYHYYQPGNLDANNKLLQSFQDEWSDQLWTKCCRLFHFKDSVAEKQAYAKIYSSQRSCVAKLDESISKRKKVLDVLNATLVVQMAKVFPELLKFMSSMRPSSLEKMLDISDLPLPECQIIKGKFKDGIGAEKLLDLIKEIANYKTKNSLENHKQLVYEATRELPDEATSIVCSFQTIQNIPDNETRFMPGRITLRTNGNLETYEVKGPATQIKEERDAGQEASVSSSQDSVPVPSQALENNDDIGFLLETLKENVRNVMARPGDTENIQEKLLKMIDNILESCRHKI